MHFYSEKWNQGQIPIVSSKMGSELLKCIPVSSNTRSFGGWTPKLSQWQFILCKITCSNIRKFVTICSKDPQQVLIKAYCLYLWLACQIEKNYTSFGEKKRLNTNLYTVKWSLINVINVVEHLILNCFSILTLWYETK